MAGSSVDGTCICSLGCSPSPLFRPHQGFLSLFISHPPSQAHCRWSAGPLWVTAFVTHFRPKTFLHVIFSHLDLEVPAYTSVSGKTFVFEPHLVLSECENSFVHTITLCFQFFFHFIGSLLDVLPSLSHLIRLWSNIENWGFRVRTLAVVVASPKYLALHGENCSLLPSDLV